MAQRCKDEKLTQQLNCVQNLIIRLEHVILSFFLLYSAILQILIYNTTRLFSVYDVTLLRQEDSIVHAHRIIRVISWHLTDFKSLGSAELLLWLRSALLQCHNITGAS